MSSIPNTDDQSLRLRYGPLLEDLDADEESLGEFLIALHFIMQGFVDFGFSVKPGDKFTTTSESGMDDVLHFLIQGETDPGDPKKQE